MEKAAKRTKTGRIDPQNQIDQKDVKQQTMPNSLVMRIMEHPDAESEADRLSAGVTSTSPAALRREMGERLGADFSSVNFHNNAESVRSSHDLGAQAWTQGRDVYFGKAGFSPSVAAHELVHTVQQGAVRGNASVSVPNGAVQLLPEKDNPKFRAKAHTFDRDEETDKALSGDVRGLTEVETQAMRQLNSSRGNEVYNAIIPDLMEMVKKAAMNRPDDQKVIKFRPKPAVSFMVRAGCQDYALRDLLIEQVNKPIGIFKVSTRTRQYKALIRSISDRLGEYQAEELAVQTGLLPPREGEARANVGKRRVNKRSYELAPEAEYQDKFNPGNIPEVEKIQDEIDKQDTLGDAYKVFAKFTGNNTALVKLSDEDEFDKLDYDVDLNLAKTKLKHMARMVWDYPELRGQIGDMELMGKNRSAKMAVQATYGSYDRTPVMYNAYYDRLGAEEMRQQEWNEKGIKQKRWNGDLDHAGNHELGHVLGSTMVSPGADYQTAKKEATMRATENSIMNEVLLKQDILTPEQKSGILFNARDELKYIDHNGEAIPKQLALQYKAERQRKINSGEMNEDDPWEVRNTKKVYKGQINPAESPTLMDRNLTSYYGRSSNGEFFAEAFGDVYTHGKNAKRLSIATVQEYEKRQKERQRMKFKYNQSSWFMKLFRKKKW